MKKKAFDYYLDKNILDNCQKKSLKLRLRWLYQGNRLRKFYEKDIIQKQERLRKGKI